MKHPYWRKRVLGTFTSFHFTSLSRTSSTVRCWGFPEYFPSLTVSSLSSYSFPFNSPFLQNLLYPFLPRCRLLPLGLSTLCSSLPGHFGLSLFPHSYYVPQRSQLC